MSRRSPFSAPLVFVREMKIFKGFLNLAELKQVGEILSTLSPCGAYVEQCPIYRQHFHLKSFTGVSLEHKIPILKLVGGVCK